MADRVVSYDFRGKFTNLTAGLAVAGKSVQDLGDKLTAVDKNGARMRAGLDTTGRAAGRIGLVAAAGFAAAVTAAANFDKAMSSVQAATHETTENMDLLRQAALDAGADTVFSATEAAAAVENLAKAGVSTADILGGGLTGALDLAAAGSLDVGSAAEIAATAMTQFGLAGSDVPHIADLLAAGAGKAQGEVTDLAMALKQSGLVADQVGLSIEETTGGLAAFASAGLLGSDAGTSFKTMLGALTPNSAKAAKLMNELGINAYDAGGNFIGLEAFAGNLRESLAGLTDQQRQAALETIFGSDAVRAASVLYEQGADGIASWTDKVNDSGYAAETAATKLDNLAGDVEALKGSLETALIGAGDGKQGLLRGLAQNATDAVNAFNDLPPSAKSAATSLLGIVAITGGAAWFGAKVIGGISDTRKALADLGVQAKVTRGQMLRFGAASAGMVALSMTDLDEKAGLANASMGALLGTMIAPGVGTGIGAFIGLTMDAAAANDELADQIKAVDDLLATAAPTTNMQPIIDQIDQATATFEEFERKVETDIDFTSVSSILGAIKNDVEETFGTSDVDEFSRAIEAQKQKVKDLQAEWDANRMEHIGTAIDQASHAIKRQTPLLKEQTDALKDSRDAARKGAEQFGGLGDKLDKAKVSLGGWLKQLEKQAEALRDFRKNAETAARKGLDEGLIKSLNEAGPAGALRMRQLANGTEEQIGRANRAFRSIQDEIEKTTDSIGGTIGELRKLNAIHLNNKTFDVHVTRSGPGLDFLSGGVRKAGGGYISGPGTGTSDSIPARLSDGEYVIKASSVAKYGVAMFDALNAQRFADGGPVGFAAGGQARTPDVQVGTAAQATARAMWDLTGKTREQLRQMDKELSARQKLLEKELEHAQKRMQGELEELRALKDARRDLVQTTAGNFMSDIFGEGATFISMLSTLAGDSANAAQFEDVLAQLSALGLDGGAFAGLAASGNLSAAQDLLAAAFANPQMIAVFEQAFANRSLAAQGAGQYAGDESLGEAVREQTKEFRASRRVTERLEAETKLLRREVRQVEKAIERLPKPIGKEVGDAVNGAATAGSKGRTP